MTGLLKTTLWNRVVDFMHQFHMRKPCTTNKRQTCFMALSPGPPRSASRTTRVSHSRFLCGHPGSAAPPHPVPILSSNPLAGMPVKQGVIVCVIVIARALVTVLCYLCVLKCLFIIIIKILQEQYTECERLNRNPRDITSDIVSAATLQSNLNFGPKYTGCITQWLGLYRHGLV